MRANKATRDVENSTVPYYNTNLPLDSLLDHLKQKIKDHWNKEWLSIVKPRLLTIKEDFYKKVVPPTLKRRNQVVISRIIIGHTKITHRFLLTKEDQPICEWCKTILTTDHFILQWKRYQRLRNQFNIKSTIKDNLTDSEIISNLLLYLKQTTLYNNI